MSLSDRLFVALQYLLPKRLITALVYRLARIETPWVRDAFIRGFCRLYAIDMDEAVVPAEGFGSFNAFFTRALRDGVRPIDADPRTVASPVDGTVAECGAIDGERLLQAELVAKRRTYTLAALLGDADRATAYIGGTFATIYLAPYNYHRVHVPLEGTLVGAHYEPGLYFSVNAATAAGVEALYARNERLVCHFETTEGPYALVFVGALNVGSVSLTGVGEVLPRSPRRAGPIEVPRRAYARGEELGCFNMGSTVVLVHPKATIALDPLLARGRRVRMGERIGRRTTA
jgi:phosphatidylserine decarboxylase